MHALFKSDTIKLPTGSGLQAALLRLPLLPRAEDHANGVGGSDPRADSHGAVSAMSAMAWTIDPLSLASMRSTIKEFKLALSAVHDRLLNYAQIHRYLQRPEYNPRIEAAAYLRRRESDSSMRIELQPSRTFVQYRGSSHDSNESRICLRGGLSTFRTLAKSLAGTIDETSILDRGSASSVPVTSATSPAKAGRI
jgi:hypothetical protein